jgi:hypothetical protein
VIALDEWVEVKAEAVLVHAMKVYRGEEGIALHILNLYSK